MRFTGKSIFAATSLSLLAAVYAGTLAAQAPQAGVVTVSFNGAVLQTAEAQRELKALDAKYAPRQAQLKALLGDSGYKQYQDYSPTIGARETAAGLASALATSDTPLSTEQAQQVQGILNETSIRQPPFGYDWATAYAKAQGVLSPPQLDVLQAIGTQAIGWQQAEAAPH